MICKDKCSASLIAAVQFSLGTVGVSIFIWGVVMESQIQLWPRHVVLACFSLLLFHTSSVNAQGPDRALVYFNTVGTYQNTFVLSPQGLVSGARYRLLADNEPTQFDRLTFVKSVEFADGRDSSPEIVRGWMYKGTDKTDNTWRIIFGKEKNRGADTYPIYYSLDGGEQFERWLTSPGTRRKDAGFSSQVHAVLWANQVDADRLGLQPFKISELDPLAPSLAWESVIPELKQLLLSTQGQGSWVGAGLVRLDGDRLLFRLSASDNCKQSLFDALRYRDVKMGKVVMQTRARTLTINELSKTRFFSSNAIDLNKVANGIGQVIETDAALLSQMSLMAEKRIGNRECKVLTRPWKELRCGQGYCQYWRLNFGFEVDRKDGIEHYKLSTVLDIGERRVDEPPTDKYIVHKYTSKNTSMFDNFQVAVNRDGQNTVVQNETVAMIVPVVVDGEVLGGQTADPLKSSSLSDVLNDGFQTFLGKMTGK